MSKRFPQFVFNPDQMEKNNVCIADEVTDFLVKRNPSLPDGGFKSWDKHTDFDHLRQTAKISLMWKDLASGHNRGRKMIEAHYTYLFYLNPDKKKLFQLAMDIGTKTLWVQAMSNVFN